MRFLAHSEDATFDATTGRFYYNLDKRVSNPTSVRVVRASFLPASDAASRASCNGLL